MKVLGKKQEVLTKQLMSQFLYLFIPQVRVLYLSIYLNSSRLILWGEILWSKVILKFDKSKLFGWTDFACIERADCSHFSSVKDPLWVLVRSWDFCIVRPK